MTERPGRSEARRPIFGAGEPERADGAPTPDSLGVPVGAVLATQQRTRNLARFVAGAVVAFIVLATGLGITGNGRPSPLASPSVAAAVVAAASPSASLTPAPTDAPTPRPRVSPVGLPAPALDGDLGCTLAQPGTAPEIQLGVAQSDPPAVRGAPPGGVRSGTGSGPPSWPVLSIVGEVRVSNTAPMLLTAEGDACMRRVVVEFIPHDPGIGAKVVTSLRTLNLNQPASAAILGRLPTGAWVVRIVVHFQNETTEPEDDRAIERFFRVVYEDAPAA